MLSLQSRQLVDPGARRAIEQAAGRIGVIGDINHRLNHLTSLDVRIDDPFVGELVAKSIDAAGAGNRVRCETSVDPIDLPTLLLTPLALLLNECVTNVLEHDFPGVAQGVIAVRLEARSEEQGDAPSDDRYRRVRFGDEPRIEGHARREPRVHERLRRST